MIPPVLVREEALFGTGLLPDTEQQIYRVPEDELYLVGTSEVPLASLHAGEILAAGDAAAALRGLLDLLPARGGRGGQGHAGIFRVHQFDKVEMFTFVEPEELGRRARAAARDRGGDPAGARDPLPGGEHRRLDDLGASAAKKYDLEAWLPGQGRYRELTSCSNTTDFQARRLDVRYRPGEGGAAPRAHAERHRRGGGPDDHRDRGEPPARGRQRRDPRPCCTSSAHPSSSSLSEAEGVGFEPTRDLTAPSGFQGRRIQPLCHPSGPEIVGRWRQYALVLSRDTS